ncbi:hypothetical protein [Deinococcus navajonensis]|uniref:Uncharacterized protein n=1 Tax=Deinococcus navajonensis TaxID=309884 RepID=A0ABV8XMN8_9DEIO
MHPTNTLQFQIELAELHAQALRQEAAQLRLAQQLRPARTTERRFPAFLGRLRLT